MLSLRLRHLLVAHAVLLVAAGAAADSWRDAERSEYTSKNGAFRFTVEPRDLHSGAPAGQAPGHAAVCTGRLERKTSDGDYEEIWEAALQNSVSPVSAIVSDGGHFVATFDEWLNMGYGQNAVVIYSSDGSVIRELSLLELLTATEISALFRSMTSVRWGGDHYFDHERALVLRVIEDSSASMRSFRELKLELPDGRLVRPDPVLKELAEQRVRCDALFRAADPPQACMEQRNEETWCQVCMSVGVSVAGER